jgi:antitoxin (DNA-binding transcriptional repressor) of toxin-antitoxin stability system
MAQYNIAEAISHFSGLVKKALMGEDVVIAQDNKTFLRLVPFRGRNKKTYSGIGQG